MKSFICFTVLFLLTGNLFSQDTLITKNGELIGAKVLEINEDEVKYKKSSNPDGPLYVIKKSEVVVIEYQNGTRDVFNSAGNNGSINDDSGDRASDRVYIDRKPALNVFLGAVALNPWNWAWGNGWYASGWARGWRGHHGGHRHGHHHGYYGRRGGGSHR
ncbi:MAG: hypothetical protein V4635_17240 [Bacteroidota bacterium]